LTRSVIIATGTIGTPKKLGIEGENMKGVKYAIGHGIGGAADGLPRA